MNVATNFPDIRLIRLQRPGLESCRVHGHTPFTGPDQTEKSNLLQLHVPRALRSGVLAARCGASGPAHSWWMARGPKPAVRSTSELRRVHVLGTLKLENGDFSAKEVNTVNGAEVMMFLVQLAWARPDLNLVHVVLDNVGYNHSYFAKCVERLFGGAGSGCNSCRRTRTRFNGSPAPVDHAQPMASELRRLPRPDPAVPGRGDRTLGRDDEELRHGPLSRDHARPPHLRGRILRPFDKMKAL